MALGRCPEYSSPPRDLTACAPARWPKRCGLGPGCRDLCRSCAAAVPVPGRVPADLHPAWPGILAWPQPCLIAALLAEPAHCHPPSSAPPARAVRGHCSALFCCDKKGGEEDHKMSPSCQGTSLVFRELSATPESERSNGSTPLRPSLPVPATKEESLRKSKLRIYAERDAS